MIAIHKIVRGIGLEPDDIIDSPVDVEIVIHQADIARANRKQPDCCVLARAACRAFPNVAEAWVYKTAVYLRQINDDGTERMVRFMTSKAARKMIAKFDATGHFVPGKVLLLAPKATETRDAIKKRNAHRKDHRKHKTSARKPARHTRANWAEI